MNSERKLKKHFLEEMNKISVLMEVGEERGPPADKQAKNLGTKQEHRFDFIIVHYLGF